MSNEYQQLRVGDNVDDKKAKEAISKFKEVQPKGENQQNYIKSMQSKRLSFGIGLAGTGKTFLAVMMAIKAYKEGSVKRIIVARPAVESGENLGSLPGDLFEKISPFMQPIFEAFEEFLDKNTLHYMLNNDLLKVITFAHMRGLTFKDAFIIVDEAQNATLPQIKMVLTRIGKNSKMVITGDPSQTDLPEHRLGLQTAVRYLKESHHISIIEFESSDIMRDPLVREISELWVKGEHQDRIKDLERTSQTKKDAEAEDVEDVEISE